MKYDPLISEILVKIKNEIKDYENRSYFNLHSRRFTETLNFLVQNIKSGASILDIGCSPGYLTVAVKKLGYNISAIDVEPDTIDSLIKNDINFDKCNLEYEKLPYPNDMFDCILFTEVAEHLLYYNLGSILTEIRRTMKKGSMLILSTPNIAALENRLFLLFGKEVINYTHNREYTLREISKIVKESGFTIKHTSYSLCRDVVTHEIPDKYINEDHVLIGSLRYPYWKNFGRALVLPFKLMIPSLRSCIFILALN